MPERRRRRHRTRHGRGLAVPAWITPGSVFALLLAGAVLWLGAQFLLQTSVEDSSASNRADGSRSGDDQFEGGADGWSPLDLVLQVGLETSGDILNPGIHPIINGVINFHSGPLSVTASTGTRGDREFLEGGGAPEVEDGTVPKVLSDAYLQAPSIAGDDAEETFRAAVTDAPSDAETHLALGAFLWSRGRLDEAGTSLEAAFAHDPRHVGANRALSAFYLATGKPIEAERHLQALVDLLDTLDTHLALGDFYLAQQRIAEAARLLEHVATMPGANGDANSRLASIAYSEARIAAAHDLIDETLASVPTHPRALLTKAGFLIIERRLEEAMALVRKAARSNPTSADAHYTLGWLLGRRQQYEEAIREFNEAAALKPLSVSTKIQLARLNLAQGHAALASDLARQALKLQPRGLGPRVLLVRTLIGEGDIDGAERDVRALLEGAPDLAEAHWLAGVIEVLRKRDGQAKKSFARAMTLMPDAYEPLEALVSLEADPSTRTDGATTTVAEHLERHPENSDLLVLAARAHAADGDPGRAEQLLRRAIEHDSASPVPHEMLGRLYLSQQRLDRAREQFEELASRDVGRAGTRAMVAIIHHAQGQVAAAQVWYQQALDIDPQLVVAANNLARLYAQQRGMIESALRLAQTAVANAPDDPTVNDTLGWIYLQKDLGALAVSSFRACVEKAPANPLYQHHLGLAYSRTEDPTRAREFLEAALRLKPDFAGAADARRILSTLE